MDINKKAFQKWHTKQLMSGGFGHENDCRYFKNNTNTPINECMCHCYELQIWNASSTQQELIRKKQGNKN